MISSFYYCFMYIHHTITIFNTFLISYILYVNTPFDKLYVLCILLYFSYSFIHDCWLCSEYLEFQLYYSPSWSTEILKIRMQSILYSYIILKSSVWVTALRYGKQLFLSHHSKHRQWFYFHSLTIRWYHYKIDLLFSNHHSI